MGAVLAAAHRVGLRGQGHRRRGGHRIGCGDDGDGVGGAVHRAGPRGGQAGRGPGARGLGPAQARGHGGRRRDPGRRARVVDADRGGVVGCGVGRPRTRRLRWTASASPARPHRTAGGHGGGGDTRHPAARRRRPRPLRLPPRRFTWKAIASTAGVVFLVALLVVTGVELIAGKPLSSIFGHAGTGTSLGGVFNRFAAASVDDTTTTSTSTSTTTSTSSSTTRAPPNRPRPPRRVARVAGATTTTTSTSGGSTTTTNPGSATTTTGDPTPTTTPRS